MYNSAWETDWWTSCNTSLNHVSAKVKRQPLVFGCSEKWRCSPWMRQIKTEHWRVSKISGDKRQKQHAVSSVESCRNTGKIQGALVLGEENSQSDAGGCLWGSQGAPGTMSRKNRNAILKRRAWEFYGTYFHTNKKPIHALTCLSPIILMAQLCCRLH